MKTPREILFERHKQAEPKLDAVRRRALAVAVGAGRPGALPIALSLGQSIQAILNRVWLELIWPSRRAWAGIAVLWLLILAANLGTKTAVEVVSVPHATPTRELAQAIQERRLLLGELLGAGKTTPAEPARPSPRPRSERPLTLRPC